MVKESETIFVLGLWGGASIFFTSNYENKIVSKDGLIAFKEIKADESLPAWSFKEVTNSYNLKSPIDLIFTTKEPERKFVQN
jgi:type III restriction enzyme